MGLKDILAMFPATDVDEAVIAAADVLCERHGARATTLLFEIELDPIYYAPDGFIPGDLWTEISTRSRDTYVEARKELTQRLAGFGDHWTVRGVPAGSSTLSAHAGAEARYADLTILSRPTGETRRDIFEGALFGSGRPVMVVPPDWTRDSIGRNVAIGWNASREAARALADASPFLETAERVTVITVDAQPSDFGHGEAPGAEIAAHLARRGLSVEIRNVDGLGRGDAAALVDECRALAADLLVIGAYGRSRLQETIFGGVTKDVVRTAPMPLFLAH